MKGDRTGRKWKACKEDMSNEKKLPVSTREPDNDCFLVNEIDADRPLFASETVISPTLGRVVDTGHML